MLFSQILRMIYDSLKSVINALKVPLFIVPGTEVDITFWELILGFLLVGIIFGFFLAPRAGSGLQATSNENKKANAEYLRQQKLKASQKSKVGGGKKK